MTKKQKKEVIHEYLVKYLTEKHSGLNNSMHDTRIKLHESSELHKTRLAEELIRTEDIKKRIDYIFTWIFVFVIISMVGITILAAFFPVLTTAMAAIDAGLLPSMMALYGVIANPYKEKERETKNDLRAVVQQELLFAANIGKTSGEEMKALTNVLIALSTPEKKKGKGK